MVHCQGLFITPGTTTAAGRVAPRCEGAFMARKTFAREEFTVAPPRPATAADPRHDPHRIAELATLAAVLPAHSG